MVVEVTNITDGVAKTATKVELFGRTIQPGESLKVGVHLIDADVRQMACACNQPDGCSEPHAIIAIGPLPSWYKAFKARRSGKISAADLKRRFAEAAPPSPPASPAPPAPEPEAAPVEPLSESKTRRRS